MFKGITQHHDAKECWYLHRGMCVLTVHRGMWVLTLHKGMSLLTRNLQSGMGQLPLQLRHVSDTS